MQFLKIISNTLHISVTHFFISFHVKKSKNEYIVQHFHRQQPQIK